MTPVCNAPAGGIVALIPAFKESEHIGAVVRGALNHVPRVLVVDDGSTDRTSPEAAAAGAEVIRLRSNCGKGAAVLRGLEHLAGDPSVEAIILVDGDGQHLTADLPRFLCARAEGHAFVLGNRMGSSEAMPSARRWTNRIMSALLSKVCGQKIPDSQCGFRMFLSHLIPVIRQARSRRFDFVSETLLLVSRAGVRIHSVPVATVYDGQASSIHPVPDTLRFLKLILRETFAPNTRRPASGGNALSVEAQVLQ